LFELARELASSMYWQGFGADGLYTLLFNPRWQSALLESVAPEPRATGGYANTPYRRLGDSDVAHLLHAALSQQLPTYMQPALISVLARWPLTKNGKVDLAALPDPSRRREIYSAPRSPREHMLCQLFASVLSVARVGIDDDFFMLGGHSLSAARLISRAGLALGVSLSIRSLFEAPTVRALAERLSGETPATAAFDTLLPIRARGTLAPLFCIHPVGGLSWAYAGLINGLDADRPIYGLQAKGIIAADTLPDSIESMAREYLQALRQVQTHGPYHLLGWSFGGLVAHAMARQLQEEGAEVGLLALMDSYPMREHDRMPPWDAEQVLRGLARALAISLNAEDAEGLSIERFLTAARQSGHVLGCLEAEQGARFLQLLEAFRHLVPRFKPQPVAGEMLFFEATQTEEIGVNWAEAISPMVWRPYLGGHVQVLPIDCAHTEMANPVAIQEIGQRIESYLRQRQSVILA